MRFVVAVVAVALLVSAAAAARPQTPRLARAQGEPLVLVGSGFTAGERVLVTLTTGYGPRQTRVVARGGRFRVSFRVPDKGCGAAWAARARGNRGSTATLTLGEAPPCIPPPRDVSP